MKQYKLLLVFFMLVSSLSRTAFATKICTPSASVSMSAAFNYCQGNTASPIIFRYSSCTTSDDGARAGTAIAIQWYKNTTNSTSGGVVVSTASCTSDTSTTLGMISYTPSTAAAGTAYYYCVITWSGDGKCNTSGSLVSDVTTAVTIISPAAAITGGSALCIGSTNSLSNGVAAGTWYSGDGTIATISDAGVVTGVAAGTVMITYSTGCGTSATKVVSVVSTPVLDDITGSTSACVGITSVLANTTAGGVWSSSNASIVTGTTGIGAFKGIAAGTATISYTVTNSCAAVTTTTTFTVNALPAAGVITGPSSVCLGDVAIVYDTIPGGVWTSSVIAKAPVASLDAPGDFSAGSTGSVAGVAVGTANISYSVTNGCGTARAVKSITVNPLPSAGTIGGTATICGTGTRTLTKTVSGGVWTSDNEAIAVAGSAGVITGVAVGTANISYAVTNGCGTSVTTKVVTVNPMPDAGTITGSNPMCIGTVDTLADTAVGGTWKSSVVGKATIDSNGVITGIAAGTSIITYTVTNGCGTARATMVITVNAFPVVAYISGTATVCDEATRTLADATAGGVWSSSNTYVAAISNTGVVTGINPGTTTVSYSFTNSCGTASAVKIMSVNPLPDAGTILGSLTLCGTAVATLSNATTGGTWSSSVTAKATIGLTSGIVTGLSAGTTNISYKVTNACGAAITTAVFTVVPIPAVGVITGNAAVCVSAATTLSDAPTYGVWSSNNTSVATICGGGVVTGVAAGTTIITFSYSNGCGTASITKVVTVNQLPADITGASSVCIGGTADLTSATTGGTWSSSNTDAVVCSGSGTITGLSSGTSTITYALGTGCTATGVVTVAGAMKQAVNSSTTSAAADMNIILFPNPNNGTFGIKGFTGSTANKEVAITVVDIAGNTIYQNKLAATDGNIEGHLSLSNLSNGMYILNVSTVTGAKSVYFTVRQ